MDIYDNIDRLLKERHMSRRQLAIAAGIPEASLASAFNRRSKNFPSERLKKIATVLNVLPSEIDPSINALFQIRRVQNRTVADINEQIDHYNYLMQIRSEFVEEDFLPNFRDEMVTGNLYTALAAIFALNAEGQKKAIEYLFDLNKIYEYRNEGAKYVEEILASGKEVL